MTFEGFETDTWEALPGAKRLTMAQREAIESDEPLLCVVAGAGAGKTRVLTLRVARRVREGTIEGDRTLVTTFSRKAAEELRTRLWSLGVAGVKAGTFHRTALGLLREHRELRNRPAPQLMTDRRRLLAEVTNGDARRTRALDSEIGWAKARLVSPDHYENEARRHRRRSGLSAEQVADAYARYETERTRRRLLDFDDLIVACADALAGDAEFADSIRWRTRHLFVDEMQDVNPAQFRLLTTMLADEPDLFVVGDPNQSVYGFNGADPTLLGRLPDLLRGTKVIRLDENHRCTPQVVAVATAVLQEGGSFSEDGEVVPPHTTRVDGPVPQVIAHATDDDEAAWAASQAKMSRTPGRRWSSIAVLTRTNAQLVKVQAAMDAARVPSRIAGSDLGPASDLRAEAADAKRGAISDADLDATDGPATDVPGGDDPAAGDHVVLTTFHRAKGLQWPTVMVLGLSAGLMPIASAQTDAAVDEERRLLYVALTRSEDELWCSWFERAGDAPSSSGRGPSPWLAAIERTVAQLQKEAAPTAASEVSARVAELRRRLAEGTEGSDTTR
ncbi:MAG TPA: ATP-dependent helicase [Acidimicrobiales bacterium]|jgi:DNA helicase-2/ATP-dependent DNA helicase PcrA|nr:ATP-dependent helicase [Acidimicrobiales bacterium]